jgi:diguanylate cyclase
MFERWRILDAIPNHIVVLDGSGIVIFANRAWLRFAEVNDGLPERTGCGVNYLALCQSFAERDPDDAALVAEQLAEVLSGTRQEFVFKYDFHLPHEKAWYVMHVAKLPEGGALVTHSNVTQSHLAQLTALALSNHDPLTGVLNRRGLTYRLQDEQMRANRDRIGLSAVLIDCDNFRDINERHGHSSGDRVLTEMAQRLGESLRPEDSLARIGGDEFLVLLPGVRQPQAQVIAERLRRSLNDTPLSLDDETAIHFTASFSVAFLDENFGFLEEILKACAAGLRSSKTCGKNRVSSAYSEHGADTILEAMQSVRVVRQNMYQLAGEFSVGVELFSEPRHPSVSAAELFQRAAELALLKTVDDHCLSQCLDEAERLPHHGDIHINVCPVTLLSDRALGLPAFLEQASLKQRVMFDVPCQEPLLQVETVRERLTLLRDQGLRFALSDVGFERGNLENVILLRPEMVKVSQHFIRGVGKHPGRMRQMARLILVIKSLGAKVLIQGLETREDVEMAKKLGAEFGQGFFWGANRSGEVDASDSSQVAG